MPERLIHVSTLIHFRVGYLKIFINKFKMMLIEKKSEFKYYGLEDNVSLQNDLDRVCEWSNT